MKRFIINLLLLSSVFLLSNTNVFPQNTNLQQLAKANHDTSNYPYWIEMMQDHAVNFFTVQRAFNIYWKDRRITKGCGWKPFKRWEYMMQQRVSPTGERPPEDLDMKAYKEYFLDTKAHTLTNTSNWQELGPRIIPTGSGGLGRLNALSLHPTDPNTIYVGAASGGLWKTTDDGLTWTSNTDNLPSLGVSAIAIDPVDPQIMYIGTGDRDNSDAPGVGVLKTTDGGTTWTPANNGMGNKVVGKLLIHPSDPQIILAATNGGIYKSADGAATWSLSSAASNFRDMVFKPGNPNIVYASADGKLYKSSNNGGSWAQIGASTIPGGYRGVIGVTPANPSVVYFVLCNSDTYLGTYLSVNDGVTFTLQSTGINIMGYSCTGGNGGSAWYDLCVAVAPDNATILYVGGVNIFKSVDAGISWTIVGHWTGDCGVAFVHADQHIFAFSPLNGYLYAGNDGGCFRTKDAGQTWDNLCNGLAISQIYKIGQSATVKDLVMNGYQDNGTSCLNGANFTNVMGGDGMDCVIDYSDANYKYGELYYGSIDRIFNFANQGNIARDGNHGITESGAWVTPFILHVTNPNCMFVGYKNVWRSTNIKDPDPGSVFWTKISANIGSENCAVLEQSPVNPDILYVAKENSRLYRTDNANALSLVWINLSAHLPNSSTPSDLTCHPTDPNIVYMTCGNKVYKSKNKGLSWTDISGTLPNVFFSSIVYCKGSQDALYLGSDIGVFYRDKSMNDWVPYTTGLPANGRVTELEIWYDHSNPANNRLRAATYGRGLWESKLYEAHPTANFTVNHTSVPTGCGIQFTDLSLGYPTSWLWHFPGGTPSTSTSQNPQNIKYMTPNTYDVKLLVTNSQGSDSLTFHNYITVSSSLLPLAGFRANDSIFCSGTPTVNFFDTSGYCPTAWQWTFSPPDVVYQNTTNANSQNPVVKFLHDGTYSVSCLITNVNGSVTVSKPGYIVIGGLVAPFADNFETGSFAAKSWSILNPDNDNTWEVLNTSGNPPGIKSARIMLFGTNSYGHRDWLITPAIDLTGLQHAALTFKHAYAQYQSDISDSLIIYVSDNCGQSWMKIYTGGDDGTGNFATHPPQPSSFVPASANDWCGGTYGSPCKLIDLGYFVGKKNVKIAFEAVSIMSNNIYLDDINIAASTGLDQPPNNDGFNIYPNPSSGNFYYSVKTGTKLLSLKVFTPQGQPVHDVIGEKGQIPETGSFDISHLSKGIYYLEGNSENGRFFRKLVLQ